MVRVLVSCVLLKSTLGLLLKALDVLGVSQTGRICENTIILRDIAINVNVISAALEAGKRTPLKGALLLIYRNGASAVNVQRQSYK